MKTRIQMLCPLLVGLCACSVEFEYGVKVGTGEKLPDPDTWVSEPPPLDNTQQARQAEVDAHLAELYKDRPIVATKQGYSGDIVDWIDSSALPLPDELVIPPFPIEALATQAGVELPQSELDRFPELLGPPGTTPQLRPDFSDYVLGNTGASSLRDYLDHHQVFGMPADQDRLYAGIDYVGPNQGVAAIINHFGGEVEEDTFSLVEMAVACPADGPVEELIGIVLSIDRKNFKGALDKEQASRPRIHVEYVRTENGKLKGVWDLREEVFEPNRLDMQNWPSQIPIPLRTVLGGEITVSTINGAQYEHTMGIFRIPSGSWWILYRNQILGHYPAKLFKLLSKGACRAHWYEEIYDGTPANWTTTDMGSGEFAEAGPGRADYIRRMMYLDPFWAAHEVTELNSTDSRPYEPNCYSRSLMKSEPLTGRLIFCGGPGSNAPLCK